MTVKEWYALNKVAEFSLCKWTVRFREEEPRPFSPQVERDVELDEGHALRPWAAALRARSPLPIRVNRGTEVRFSRCCGLRSHRRWRLLRPCSRSRPRGFWAVSQEMGADFAMVLDFCGVFGGGCSLSAPPTRGNVGAARRFGPIRPAKPPISCKWSSRVARGARRHCGG